MISRGREGEAMVSKTDSDATRQAKIPKDIFTTKFKSTLNISSCTYQSWHESTWWQRTA